VNFWAEDVLIFSLVDKVCDADDGSIWADVMMTVIHAMLRVVRVRLLIRCIVDVASDAERVRISLLLVESLTGMMALLPQYNACCHVPVSCW